jgi:hypothetical protein
MFAGPPQMYRQTFVNILMNKGNKKRKERISRGQFDFAELDEAPCQYGRGA